MGDQERRQFIRLRSRLVTFIKHVDTGKVERVLTKDIGGVGVCFISHKALPPGTPLEVEIKLPDFERPITFTASVVWSRVTEPAKKSYQFPTVEIGVTFAVIGQKQRSLIMQYAALNALPGA